MKVLSQIINWAFIILIIINACCFLAYNGVLQFLLSLFAPY